MGSKVGRLAPAVAVLAIVIGAMGPSSAHTGWTKTGSTAISRPPLLTSCAFDAECQAFVQNRCQDAPSATGTTTSIVSVSGLGGHKGRATWDPAGTLVIDFIAQAGSTCSIMSPTLELGTSGVTITIPSGAVWMAVGRNGGGSPLPTVHESLDWLLTGVSH